MKRALIILCLLLLSSWALAATSPVRLSYPNESRDYVGQTHYLETTTKIKTISRKNKGLDENVRMESFRQIQVAQEVHLQPRGLSSGDEAHSGLLVTTKTRVIREETERGSPRHLLTRILHTRMDTYGEPQDQLRLSDLPYLSFPVIFPGHPIKVGDEWRDRITVLAYETLPIDINIRYGLKRLQSLARQQIAEITYTITAELKTTEITSAPTLSQRIEQMRTRGMERIAISGKGSMSFNLAKQIPMVQTLDFVVELTEHFVIGNTRELQESIREIHKAEVFRAL